MLVDDRRVDEGYHISSLITTSSQLAPIAQLLKNYEDHSLKAKL